jgi:hypothetical protein
VHLADGDVQDLLLLEPQAFEGRIEVGSSGLVGADLLGCDKKFERRVERPNALHEDACLDVREDREPITGGESAKGRAGVRERRPGSHALGEILSLRLRDVSALEAGRSAQGLGEDLPVRAIGSGLELAFDALALADETLHVATR